MEAMVLLYGFLLAFSVLSDTCYSAPKVAHLTVDKPICNISSSLQMDGVYFKLLGEDSFGDTYCIFRFYNDGVVIKYTTYEPPDETARLAKVLAGNTHGYYTVRGDSLYFSTRPYYDSTLTFYRGVIYKDSIRLRESGPLGKYGPVDTYYFLAEQN